MMYVTLARGKQHLNMDHNEDDTLIASYIEAASSAVKNYLKSASPFEVERDSNDNPIRDSSGEPVYVVDSSGDRVPATVVQQATLLLLGIFYDQREGEAGVINPQWVHGYLPTVVISLLYQLRDPALA